MAEVNFKSKGLYRLDIDSLRTALKHGRTGYMTIKLRLSPLDAPVAKVVLDRKSLYIVGFQGKGEKWWYFSDAVQPSVEDSWNKLPLKGDHTTLGTDKSKSAFTSAAPYLLDGLASYEGGNADHLKSALSFVAVAVSEALRFPEIQQAIENLLSGVSFSTAVACETLMKNWSGLTTQASKKVAVAWQKS
ncbi:MAG TPA: ribosome-inactivating family protein [Thermoanaerobaculia bacterium]|nr:ribosome-inactivating family protein [Thermoanaerobaculia bacterium]